MLGYKFPTVSVLRLHGVDERDGNETVPPVQHACSSDERHRCIIFLSDGACTGTRAVLEIFWIE